jgi:tetratricopeptide (TPR) repeat protein
MPSRLEQLREHLKSRPNDPFVRYAIGIELKNAGQSAEARAAFAELIRSNPEYVPTYYHFGQTLEQLSEFEEAVKIYETGIVTAKAAGDAHAAEELARALQSLRELSGG